MPGKVRRIVTGVNAAGRSFILSDTMLPTAPVAPGAAVRTGLWTTSAAPASNEGTNDPVPDGVIMRTPPDHRGGTVVRITDIVPDKLARLRSRRAPPAELQDHARSLGSAPGLSRDRHRRLRDLPRGRGVGGAGRRRDAHASGRRADPARDVPCLVESQ